MTKHGKKYLEAKAKINPEENYEPRKALELVKETAYADFDETVEVHMRMGLDPRQSETVRVLVFAQGEGAKAAEKAGADYVAEGDEWIKKIEGGWTEFDVAIATPDMMGAAGRLGRVLGPRGLMPNPKAGTVVPAEDLARAIDESKAGRVEFRLDKTANIHVSIGKTSFELDKLYANFAALMSGIRKARPAAAKGAYIRRIVVTSTMGPGVKVDPAQALAME